MTWAATLLMIGVLFVFMASLPVPAIVAATSAVIAVATIVSAGVVFVVSAKKL